MTRVKVTVNLLNRNLALRRALKKMAQTQILGERDAYEEVDVK
jgi:hypothetical protein